jgi:Rad3-related DNA helicase
MVIMVGIPYPAFKDLIVVAKKKYQDKWYAKDRVHLSGDAWYSQQAFRALNQAIGRCIRHRLDHGAIILADPRFASNRSVQQNLSKWVRNQVNNTAYTSITFGVIVVAVYATVMCTTRCVQIDTMLQPALLMLVVIDNAWL